MDMDFRVARVGGFTIEHCCTCSIPGYLVVSPEVNTSSIGRLPRGVLEQLGPALALAIEAIEAVVRPERVYCAQFGEEQAELHFHIFPRTLEVTAEYRRAYPEHKSQIRGPVLLDWARSHYRCSKAESFRVALPTITALKAEFERITNRPTGHAEIARR